LFGNAFIYAEDSDPLETIPSNEKKQKAQEAFPANNRGVFAQELIKEVGYDLDKSEKTGSTA
jgi:hypothetical protein